ncbi:MAG: hypothetical protein ACI8UO_004627 [Verrucomicrobiales bacterium]|jgi:hypothetical protein
MDDALKGGKALAKAFVAKGKPGVPTSRPSDRVPLAPEQRLPVNVRLPVPIAHGLLDAANDRKKRRAARSSQQDIVAEALEPWLREQGYLKSSDLETTHLS